MNLPDLLCGLRSFSGTQLPVCGMENQLRAGCAMSPRWPLVPSAASYPHPQEWGSVALEMTVMTSLLPQCPRGHLLQESPGLEGLGPFLRAEIL